MTALAQRRGFATPRAQFAPDPARRAMVAKVQIARKELRLDDGDYRAIVERITGATSSKDLSIGQLDKLLAEFARLGWTAVQKRTGRAIRAADHPAAKKARAMLISLGLLGVIRSADEGALEAFARRQLGCERLQWADQAQVYMLIEALKAIATRNGWDQSVAGIDEPVWTLKYRLCEAIHRRLVAAGALPPTHRLRDSAYAEIDIVGRAGDLTEKELERLSAALGAKLAAHVAALGAKLAAHVAALAGSDDEDYYGDDGAA